MFLLPGTTRESVNRWLEKGLIEFEEAQAIVQELDRRDAEVKEEEQRFMWAAVGSRVAEMPRRQQKRIFLKWKNQ